MWKVDLWNFQSPLKNRVGVQNPRSPCLAQYNLLKKQLMPGPSVDPKNLFMSLDLFMSSGIFVMTKVRYFLMVQIYNLRTLEVEHDLETCQKP
jgi:hypothetical protein